jgi:membrane protease YdiL (CAAX protease family)
LIELLLLRQSNHFYALTTIMALSAGFSAVVAKANVYGLPDVRFAFNMRAIVTLGAVASVVVLTPIAEELYFRRWLWNDLGTIMGRNTAGLCVCLLFTALHMFISPAVGLVILPLALLLWAAREISRSIVPGIAMHAFHNAVVLFGFWLF